MKLTVLIFAFLFFAGSTFGQTSFKPGVGLNFTSITATSDDVSGKIGYQFGGSVQFGKKFYIEPGLFYMSENAEATTNTSGVTTVSDSQLNGFRVPLAIGFNILGNTDSAFALRAFGGGSAFFLSKVSNDLVKSDFNSPTWGVFAGVGADFAIIFIDLSYEWSVSNVQKNVTAIDFGKSNGIFLTAGLRF
jgi:hypothetical protein